MQNGITTVKANAREHADAVLESSAEFPAAGNSM
jgi:hypothetical protein